MFEEDKNNDRSFIISDEERVLIDVHPRAGRLTVPEGVRVSSLYVEHWDVRVDGSLGELSGTTDLLCGEGEVETISNANIGKIMLSLEVDTIKESTVGRINECRVDTINSSSIGVVCNASIGDMLDSTTRCVGGTASIYKATNSRFMSIIGRAFVEHLEDRSSIGQLTGSATVKKVDSTTIIDVTSIDASVLNLYGTLRVAAGDSYVRTRKNGKVIGKFNRPTIVHYDGLKSDYEWADQCVRDDDDGMIYVYKATNHEGMTGESYDKPTHWEPGKTVTCDDWEPSAWAWHGLHVSPTVSDALYYVGAIYGLRYFRCKVDPTTLIPLGQDSAKVPSAYVVEEVDELGNPL